MKRGTCAAAAWIIAALLPAGADAAHRPRISRAPADFYVQVSNDNGYRIDTRTGTITKDLVARPDTTIRLRLSKVELDTLYTEFVASGLFQIEEPHPQIAPEDRNCSQDPSTNWVVSVRANRRVKRFAWSTEMCLLHRTHDWDVLMDAMNRIEGMVVRRPEFRRLPRPVGGYL